MQIVKYKWEYPRTKLNGFSRILEPSLFLRSNENFQRMALFDNHISLNIKQKRCIGFFKDGKYHSCPENKIIESGWSCEDCINNDDYFRCIQCTGEECINLKKREECKENRYFVYLAAFDSLLKVGISYEYRILERLVEQGADFGAKIAFLKDGKTVRMMEQSIKNSLNIADRIMGKDKHDLLFCDPNKAAQSISLAIKELKSRGFDLIEPEIYDLRGYYRLHNVFARPSKLEVHTGMEISGKIVSAKGNILIIENGHSFFSVNTHSLIGRNAEISSNGVSL